MEEISKEEKDALMTEVYAAALDNKLPIAAEKDAGFPLFQGSTVRDLNAFFLTNVKRARELRAKYGDRWIRFHNMTEDGEAVCRNLLAVASALADKRLGEWQNRRRDEVNRVYGQSGVKEGHL